MFVSELRWTPKRQGNLGELSAIAWFTQQGAIVWRALFEHPHVDLIAEVENRLVRVQVKTSRCWRNERWEVTLATRGGNQTWNGLTKVLTAERCDALFVHVGDGRRWYIPIQAVEGGHGLLLGGPKYEAYEVEPGDPLPARPKAEIAR